MKKHSELNWPRLISLGKALVGKPYVFGSEVDLTNPDPSHIKSIDCSELVEWLFPNGVGLSFPDGSYNQAKICTKVGGNAPILIGDLGFKWNPDTEVIHHVGVYIGENTVLEAKGKQWGVVLTPLEAYIGSTHFAYWGRHRLIADA